MLVESSTQLIVEDSSTFFVNCHWHHKFPNSGVIWETVVVQQEKCIGPKFAPWGNPTLMSGGRTVISNVTEDRGFSFWIDWSNEIFREFYALLIIRFSLSFTHRVGKNSCSKYGYTLVHNLVEILYPNIVNKNLTNFLQIWLMFYWFHLFNVFIDTESEMNLSWNVLLDLY